MIYLYLLPYKFTCRIYDILPFTLHISNTTHFISHNIGTERHLHEDRWKVSAEAAASYNSSGASHGVRVLSEITLTVPIRYSTNDPIEKWLNDLLCLDVTANSTRLLGE